MDLVTIDSIQSAMRLGKGIIKISDKDNNVAHFSKYLMCPTTGISYDEPQPNSFSFNSPYGACERCDGLGYIFVVDKESVMPTTVPCGGNKTSCPLAKPAINNSAIKILFIYLVLS